MLPMATTTIWQEQVQALRALGLTEADIARATGAARPTVRSWGAGTRTPRPGAQTRIAELVEVLTRLAELLPAEYLPVWLRRPLAAFGNRPPLEIMAAGQGAALWSVVEGIEQGSFS